MYMGGGTRVPVEGGRRLGHPGRHLQVSRRGTGRRRRVRTTSHCSATSRWSCTTGSRAWAPCFAQKLDTGHLVTAPAGVGPHLLGQRARRRVRGRRQGGPARPLPRRHRRGYLRAARNGRRQVRRAGPLPGRGPEPGAGDATGRVIGVQATVGGTSMAIQAKRGVVLTAGAYTLNKDMVAATCPPGVVIGSETAAATEHGHRHHHGSAPWCGRAG